LFEYDLVYVERGRMKITIKAVEIKDINDIKQWVKAKK
jgi:nucleosome binding factor SPN SPT16 subunit